MPRRPRGPCIAALAAVAGLSVALLAGAPVALAQGGPPGPGGSEPIDLGHIVQAVVSLITGVAGKTEDKVLEFLQTVELFNADAELDRLVGDPRELSDSTAYKLSLLPFHIRYPIYKQLVGQMTRQDDLRSRRVYNVTPDSADIISLQLAPTTEADVQDEVRRSLLTHFSAREIIDLGFFVMSQQMFFPEGQEGWQQLKHRIARGAPALAGVALLAGAALDAGALSQSTTVAKLSGGKVRIGWYGSFRRLGLRLHPALRSGLTLVVPGLQVAAGMAAQIRRGPAEAGRAFELSVREGWLSRLARPSGWDAFFEGALRRAFDMGPQYEGGRTATRVGFFARREEVPGWPDVTLRGSAEGVFHLGDPVAHFAVGLGLEHAPTGLSVVLQSSRTPYVRTPSKSADTRGGIFVAGTMERPTAVFVERMNTAARLAREEWEAMAALDGRQQGAEKKLRLLGTPGLSLADARAALAQIDRARAGREEHLTLLAARLADYLECRRVAYTVSRWTRGDGDLYGPLDPRVLSEARDQVFARLRDLSGALLGTRTRLERIHGRYESVLETVHDLGRDPSAGALLAGYREELGALEKVWQRESEHAAVELHAYAHYRDQARRMMMAAGRRVTVARNPDPVSPAVIRSVLALRASSTR